MAPSVDVYVSALASLHPPPDPASIPQNTALAPVFPSVVRGHIRRISGSFIASSGIERGKPCRSTAPPCRKDTEMESRIISKDDGAVAQIVRNNIGAADIVGRGAGMLSLEDNE